MEAIQLVKNGPSKVAFQQKEVTDPTVGDNDVLINVSTFGLNYADVMARKGIYNDAPPLPSILGYEVVGTIERTGKGVRQFNPGDRVVALTRFGGYARKAVSDYRAVVKLPDALSDAAGTALATQYVTAFYSAILQANIQDGEEVLIHAAAGGVGTALVQLAKWRGCTIWGTAGSEEKLDYLRSMGVDHPINYREAVFSEVIKRAKGKDKIDAIFDPIGGKSFKRDREILSWGGRLVTFGVSNWSNKKGNLFDKIKLALDFGFVHPLGLLMKSQSIIGVNLLRVADVRPQTIQLCMQEVTRLCGEGVLNPHVGNVFKASKIADAHDYMEHRKSIGKVAVEWD